MMIASMLVHELRYWRTDRTAILAVVVAFCAGLVMTAGNAGMFSTDSPLQRFSSVSPMMIYDTSVIFLKLFIFIIPSIAAASFVREVRCGFHHLMFAYPIGERHFVAAKLLGAHAALIVMVSAFAAGTVVVLLLSGTEELLAPANRWVDLLSLVTLHLLPNVLLVAALTVLLTHFSGSLTAGFAVPVVVLLGREALLRLTAGSSAPEWRLFDPFGESVVRHVLSLHPPGGQDGVSLPLHGMFILNRAIWGTVTILLYVSLFSRFTFSRSFITGRAASFARRDVTEWSMLDASPVLRTYTTRSWWMTAVTIAVMEWMSILRSGTFRVLVVAGTFLIAVIVTQINRPFGVVLVPATWVILAFPLILTSLMLQFVTFLYAGILLERPVTTRMAPLIDASPVPDWTLAVSKLLTLIMLQSVLLAALMSIGIAVQLFQDIGQIEPAHYLFDLFVLHLSGFAVWGAAAILVHILTAQTGIGLVVLLIAAAGITQLPVPGLEHPLFQFNRTPYDTFTMYYSEMSGYGHSLLPFLLYRSFWVIAAILIMLIGIMLWRRGYRAPLQFNRHAVPCSAVAIVAALLALSGLWISTDDSSHQSPPGTPGIAAVTAFTAHQPRVTRTRFIVDINPERHGFSARGTYSAFNRGEEAVDSLFISFNNDVVTEITLSKSSGLSWSDPERGVMLFLLREPLRPGDSLTVQFMVRNRENTLFRRNSPVLSNGTYFTSLLFPSVGIQKDGGSSMDHYRSFDSDRIDLEIDISTSGDQTAIAPGELVASWKSGGRNHYRYRPLVPVTNDAGFVSARYAVTRDRWNGITIEVYHHPDHDRNVRHMIHGVTAALRYCTERYGPYPHSIIRLAEYSRALGEYAQSFPAFIPYSELGFMVDAERGAPLNIPFLGGAHETAHQWWGMQALPADLPGAKMITEGMAEFVSMKSLEAEFGPDASLRFVERASMRYHSGRSSDEGPEPSLLDNPGNDKAYIPYHKGLLAFHAAHQLSGDAVFSASMREFFIRAQRSQGPYTTSCDMFGYIVRATPDSLRSMLSEWFTSVTVVHAAITSVVVTRLPSETYAVDLSLRFRKMSDGTVSGPFAHPVELMVHTGAQFNGPQRSMWVTVTREEETFRLIVDAPPTGITLDPMFLLPDPDRSDNDAIVSVIRTKSGDTQSLP